MDYISLKKIYYTDNKNFDTEYKKRFNSTGTKHFDIEIKEYNRNNTYPAFICYTEEIPFLTEKIYKKLVSYLDIKRAVPQILLRQFILSCLVDEIQSTNEIEGVHSTKKQIRSVLENQTNDKKISHLKSIIDKYRKIIDHNEISFFTCEDIRRFYDTFVLDEVISEHPDCKPDGKIFRKDQVSVESPTGKTLHQGIFPEEKIIHVMSSALSILNNTKIPSLIRIGIFHYLFGYIHPFYDGNGRTSRFITSYYLAKELDEIIALRLSVIIKKNKNSYYKLFQDANSEFNRGDLTVFIIQFLELLERALIDTINILTKKMEQLETYSSKLKKIVQCESDIYDIYYILLQAAFFYGEGATINQIKDTIGVSRVTAQKRLNEIPPSYLIINKDHKPYHYKLNMLIFKNQSFNQ